MNEQPVGEYPALPDYMVASASDREWCSPGEFRRLWDEIDQWLQET